MGLIQLDLENLRVNNSELPQDKAQAGLKAFLQDMAADKSSFFDLPEKSTWEHELARIQPLLAGRIPDVDTFIHIGIGGSGLGAETIVQALGAAKAPRFHFVDNIDPDALTTLLERADPQRALVYVVSKSGGTMETLAAFTLVYQWLEKHLGPEQARYRLVFCTDPKKGALRKLAGEWDVPTFEIPPNLGGRFSALSAVGLFPALVAGVDCKALLKGAHELRADFLATVQRGALPPIADLAHKLVHLYQTSNRNITVLMPYSQKLKLLGAWFTQLWAESLGKNKKGITPVGSVGATDQHSILQLLRDGPQDKVVGFVEVLGFHHMTDLRWRGPQYPEFEEISGITMNQLMDAELNATRNVLINNEKPIFSIRVPRLIPHVLGQILFCLETLTALSGYYLGIDPFDQPGVEEGKILTRDYIRACKKSLMS